MTRLTRLTNAGARALGLKLRGLGFRVEGFGIGFIALRFQLGAKGLDSLFEFRAYGFAAYRALD